MLESVARMLVFFVCTAPDGRNSTDPVQREKAELDTMAAAVLVREFNLCTLEQVTRCIDLLLAAQTPESLRTVLSTPGGAEVIRSVVVHGQDLADANSGSEGAKTWASSFANFLKMAEEGIKAKESN